MMTGTGPPRQERPLGFWMGYLHLQYPVEKSARTSGRLPDTSKAA